MDNNNIQDSRLMPKIEIGFKEAEYIERLVESLIYVPFLYLDDMHLEIPTFDTDKSMQPSTEEERLEDDSDFGISLDSWLKALTDEEFGQSGEQCSIRPELMLSPAIIRAPLRSVRSDKRAQIVYE